MTPNFRSTLEKTELTTAREEDKLIHHTEISLDEERLYFTAKYQIFKGYKKDRKGEFILSEHMDTMGEKIPDYNVLSVERTFRNNYLGVEEMEKLPEQFDTEAKVKAYFNLA